MLNNSFLELDISSPFFNSHFKQRLDAPMIGKSDGTSYSICWENLSYSIKQGKKYKRILHGLNGKVESGQLLAIMGPSGCGKTTLLDILSDRIETGCVEGNIYINQEKRGKDFKKIASYVSQEDSLEGCFTVLETVQFAAALALPSQMSTTERDYRCERVIEAMGLSSCTNTLVGNIFRKGISGGQKRRVSIAIELLSEPKILLLDEPTSGLDSAAALNIMEHIKGLTKSDRSVILTIHQPSSSVWKMFSHLMLLANGYTVYYGPTALAIPYFTELNYPCPDYCNPGDFFLNLINVDFDCHGDVDSLVLSYENSKLKSNLEHSIVNHVCKPSESNMMHFLSGPNIFLQTSILIRRQLQSNARNPGIYWVRMFMYTCLSVMVGTMYLYSKHIEDQGKVALLYYVQAFMVFMSVAVLPFFIEERAVFIRERANWGLRPSAYVISNFISSIPGILLISLVASIITVFLAGLQNFLAFFVNLFISLIVAESLMRVIGAASPHYIIGIAVGAGIYGMFMLCEGFLVRKSQIPWYWIWGYYTAFHTYSFRSFMYNEFFPRNTPLLMSYSVEDINVISDMSILVLYALFLQLIFFYILHKFHTGRR